jgi:hypothetical protein
MSYPHSNNDYEIFLKSKEYDNYIRETKLYSDFLESKEYDDYIQEINYYIKKIKEYNY